jgi:hypothetical protein
VTISYLDRLKAKIQETPMGEEPSKPSKPPSHLEAPLTHEPSKPSKPPKYPLGYTDAEREAARRDAERLGYGINRTVH